MSSERPLLGVLGGMGPLASADFMAKLAAIHPARRDQDHLRVIMVSDPTIPDRSAALKSGDAEQVTAAMVASIRRLESAGAQALAIPCNTAHFWLEALRKNTSLPILSIIDATVSELRERHPHGRARVAVLGTPATMNSTLYSAPLESAGFSFVPAPAAAAELTWTAIDLVKANEIQKAGESLRAALTHLGPETCDAVLLACTELPLALGNALSSRYIDTTYALARYCVRWGAAPRASR